VCEELRKQKFFNWFWNNFRFTIIYMKNNKYFVTEIEIIDINCRKSEPPSKSLISVEMVER
jgi:hypothetical protein